MTSKQKPQTEISAQPGMLKSDGWCTDTIGAMLQLTNGRAFKPSEWKARGLPIIRIQNLNDPLTEYNYCDSRVEDRHLVRAGDLLFAWSGTLGTSFGARRWNGPNGVLNQHIFKVSPKGKALTSRYALLALKQAQALIEREAHGFKSSFVHIKKSDLTQITITFPESETEQNAICDAVEDSDAWIASLEALIAKKRDLKQAAMQQLLTGKTRLPGFSGNWNDVSLGELFIFKNGLNKAKEFFGHGSPIINYMDVFGSAGIRAHEVLGKVSVTTDEIRTYGAQKGDVFFTRTSETTDEIGISAVLLETVPNCVFSGFVLRARPKTQMLEDQFKKYCFSSRHVRDQIIASASYTTRALTNGRNLSVVRMAVPEPDEQIAIAKVLSDMDEEIAALEAEAEKARAIKQGMMQTLLTGKVRLI